jgi:peroxiredoxin Q/BCP
MRSSAQLLSGAVIACGLLAAPAETTTAAAPAATVVEDLKAGDPAPDFTLPGSDGKTYSLAQLKGKHVVLAWFPMAFTGG